MVRGGVGPQRFSWQQSGAESQPDRHHAGYRALGTGLVFLANCPRQRSRKEPE